MWVRLEPLARARSRIHDLAGIVMPKERGWGHRFGIFCTMSGSMGRPKRLECPSEIGVVSNTKRLEQVPANAWFKSRLGIATGLATKVANTPEIHAQQQRPQLAVFRHRLYRTTSTFQPSAFDSHV